MGEEAKSYTVDDIRIVKLGVRHGHWGNPDVSKETIRRLLATIIERDAEIERLREALRKIEDGDMSWASGVARAALLEGLLGEARMYALGNDCTTRALIERIDAALRHQGVELKLG